MNAKPRPSAAPRRTAARVASDRAECADHHASHATLIDRMVAPCAPKRVDAIIVPTARPVAYIRGALLLAHELGCAVVVLCSRRSRARDVAAEARRLGVGVIAVDVGPVDSMPEFRTTAVLADPKLWRFRRHTDTSLKRNIGLAMARMLGWDRIVFLDDDIDIRQPDDLRTAAALLDHYDAVGLCNDGFPDNSVVCHAYRAVGGPQDSFIGGGALAVRGARTTSFFPNIYNEDWFFLLNEAKLRPVAAAGKVVQKPYDPYAHPERARSEEFGDCLAEGIYALLDTGGRVPDATEVYWREFLDNRGRLIDWILARVPGLDLQQDDRDRMVAALKAAKGRQAHITPAMCVEYLRAWVADRRTWRSYLERLPRCPSPVDALRHLGLNTHLATAPSPGVPVEREYRRDEPAPATLPVARGGDGAGLVTRDSAALVPRLTPLVLAGSRPRAVRPVGVVPAGYGSTSADAEPLAASG